MSEPTLDNTWARFARVMGWPSTLISPRVGAMRPSSIFIVVDLPEPFGPSKPWTTPGATLRSRLWTTSVRP